MAIVANLARPTDAIDPAYCTYNRTVAGEPNTLLTPLFVDEIVLDTTNNILWKALGSANNTWVALTSAN